MRKLNHWVHPETLDLEPKDQVRIYFKQAKVADKFKHRQFMEQAEERIDALKNKIRPLLLEKEDIDPDTLDVSKIDPELDDEQRSKQVELIRLKESNLGNILLELALENDPGLLFELAEHLIPYIKRVTNWHLAPEDEEEELLDWNNKEQIEEHYGDRIECLSALDSLPLVAYFYLVDLSNTIFKGVSKLGKLLSSQSSDESSSNTPTTSKTTSQTDDADVSDVSERKDSSS